MLTKKYLPISNIESRNSQMMFSYYSTPLYKLESLPRLVTPWWRISVISLIWKTLYHKHKMIKFWLKHAKTILYITFDKQLLTVKYAQFMLMAKWIVVSSYGDVHALECYNYYDIGMVRYNRLIVTLYRNVCILLQIKLKTVQSYINTLNIINRNMMFCATTLYDQKEKDGYTYMVN